MKNNDKMNLQDLYEEGIMDRISAQAKGFGAGIKGFVSGQGYGMSKQNAQVDSLMKSAVQKMLVEIQKFETDARSYPNVNPQQKAQNDVVLNNVANIRAILQNI
jgi:predicted signal transduction protein with EAL and GGDEF domain